MLRSRDRSQPLVAELLEGDIGRVPLEGDGHRDVELVRRREKLTLSDQHLSEPSVASAAPGAQPTCLVP